MGMEIQFPVVAKRLWNVLRITFFMIRKGLVSKRKLMMDMNLMMKRGRLLRKSFTNLMSHHHHSHSHSHSHSAAKMTRGGYGIQDYEFSCSNSPAINPVFSHVSKRKHHPYYYFPCINSPEAMEDEFEAAADDDDGDEPKAVVFVPNVKTPDYIFNFRHADHNQRSPLLSSPFSVRISNYSSEEDEVNIENEINVASVRQVDDEAEEFIKRFYEQLRLQSRMQLLQYQEMDCQDMLAS